MLTEAVPIPLKKPDLVSGFFVLQMAMCSCAWLSSIG
jgi:hypothetical protein